MSAGTSEGPGSEHRAAGFIERIGAALVAPRRALAAADTPAAAGKTGGDVAWLIALAFLATHTREVVLSVWLAGIEGILVGLSTLAGSLSRAVTMDLAFLFAAGIGLTVLAGRKRAVSRDLDLACVAFVPIAAVDVAATLLLRLLQMGPGAHGVAGHLPAIDTAVSVLAYGWALVVLGLAWQTARARTDDAPPETAARAARARWAGRLVLALAAVLLVVQARWIAGNMALLRPVSSGDQAPALALHPIDARGQVRGRATRLADLHGQVVLLDFWATWCNPCLRAMPALERIHQRHRDQGLAVLSINLDDAAKARAVLDSLGSTLPLFADDGTAADRYRVSTIPHLVLIDRLGMIRYVHRGLTGESALEAQVQQLLASPAP